MSIETCKLCNKDSTPWFHINGHICIDCFHLFTKNFQLEWISVKDRFPEKDGRYLVVEDHPNRWVGISYMRDGKFDISVLYWMPLPEAPND